MSGWSFSASTFTIGLAVVVWLVAGGVSYLTWQRNRARRGVVGLETLRFVVVSLVVFTLWQPELDRRWRREDKPTVVVLCDASGSMATRDVLTSQSNVIARAAWVSEQRATAPWAALSNRYQLVVEDFAGGGANTNAGTSRSKSKRVEGDEEAGTDIDAALEETLGRYHNLRAVVLLSDGDWNSGKSPTAAATRLRVRDVPVFAVGVGSQEYLPDLAIERVSAPVYGLLGEQVFVGFTLRSHLARDVRTTVTLRDEYGAESARDVVIPAMGEVDQALFWTPLREGPTRLTLELPVEKDEFRADNNVHKFSVAIRKEVLQVLVVDSLPRWEYRYLRNALERDPGVNADTLLFHPGLGVGGGRNYLAAFPATKEALSKYDVVFLGDVGIGPGELSLSDAGLLQGLVEQQGSGLVFLPGRRGRELTLLNTPLGGLLPVELDEKHPEGYGTPTPSQLALTAHGRGHLLTMLASSEAQNAQVWQQLPGFYWHAAVRKSKPGADVLAVHEGERNEFGRLPLLVTRPQGNGKVLFLGIDSAWRWRRGVEDTYHYRFWGQVVRWMSYQRHLAQDRGFRVFHTPENPHRGDKLLLHATVFDAAGMPLTRGTVLAEITAPSGRAEQVPLQPVDGGWGVFDGAFVVAEQGAYRLRVQSDDAGRELKLEIAVRGEQREQVGRPAQLTVLREIAQITRGGFGKPENVAAFIEKISALPESNPMEHRLRLWCHPLWGGAILGLLAVYWVGRKMVGLV